MRFVKTLLGEKYRRFLPLLILIGLTVVTFLTLSLTRISQELRSRAAVDTAILSFSPSTVNINPNQTFNVATILNTNGQAIVGADIIVQFDQTKLTLETVTLPSPLPATFQTYAPVTTSGGFDAAKVVADANTSGLAQFGLIAFNWTTEQLTTPFNGVISPMATLTFRAKTGTSGGTAISYKYDGATATTDSNVVIAPAGGDPEDILANVFSPVAVIIGGASPAPSPTSSPLPSPTPTALPSPSASPVVSPSSSPVNCTVRQCGDYNASGAVDVQDIIRVANRWGLSTGQTNFDILYDLNCDGTINILDIQREANSWGGVCQ